MTAGLKLIRKACNMGMELDLEMCVSETNVVQNYNNARQYFPHTPQIINRLVTYYNKQ